MHQILVLTFALLSVVLSACNDEGSTPVTKQSVEKMIQEKAPVGTDRSMIISMLDEKKIEHSGHAKKDSPIVLAILRETPKTSSTIVRKAVQIRFEFDQFNKLAKYSVDEQFTGP